MSPKQAWKKLGIAPTPDKRAVKRAYAAKLKAMDPDQDPKAFLALREALQTATWEAQYLAQRQEAGEDAAGISAEWDDLGEPPVQIDPASPIEDDEAAMARGTDVRGEEFIQTTLGVTADEEVPEAFEEDDDWYDDDDYDQTSFANDDPRGPMTAILWAEAGSPVDETALTAAAHALLADPKMEQVDHLAEIEDWLAWTLAQTIPRSDAIIPMVAGHFNWARHLKMVGQNYGMMRCASRAEDLACIERLKKPTHRWHAAFNRLLNPPPSALSFADKRFRKSDIADLLESLRTHNPSAEMALDADHVALWDQVVGQKVEVAQENASGCSWYSWLLAAWFLFQVLRMMGSGS